MSRKNKAFINILFSLLLEVVTAVSGFIVPLLIIQTFGSQTNGLINSINGFIGYITLLQSGVGSVIRASLYRPLANSDHDKLCVIVKTTERFFRKIAYITVIYILILCIIFPSFIVSEFDWLYTASLVIIVGISTAAQYFFGITYQMVLEADQRSYVFSIMQIITVLISTIASIVMINLGYSIQIVKLCSAVFFVLRPLFVGYYTRKRYSIDKNVQVDNSLISQRWDGMAQGIAYFLHTKTPVFMLTLFSNMSNVSIFSIYAFVTTGLTSIINCIDKAIRAVLGNIIAINDEKALQSSFSTYLTLMHMLATTCFVTASITVINFVSIYTAGIHDAEYIQPMFSLLIILAEYLYCLRMPYNAIINAAGRFKETKNPAIIEALLSIIISLVLVQKFDLIGVAIGTLVAMGYRTCSFIRYLHKEIVYISYISQLRRYTVTAITYVIPISLSLFIDVNTTDYLEWIIYAMCVFIIVSVQTCIINLIFERKNTIAAIKSLIGRKNK